MFEVDQKPRTTAFDLSETQLRQAQERGLAAVDIETSGLDWRSQRIGLCQVYVPGSQPALIKTRKGTIPVHLLKLLSDASVQKIFHHAMFDLRFLVYHWQAKPENIVCTKIASKLIDPEKTEGHSLSAILVKYLNVRISKTERQSDWLTWDLSDRQVAYASVDVIYLPELYDILMSELELRSKADLARHCFAHIPTRVQLEILGYKDVYEY